jgi:hypothetical protein
MFKGRARAVFVAQASEDEEDVAGGYAVPAGQSAGVEH